MSYPNKPWDWKHISRHPNIMLSDVLANSEKPWNWKNVSRNPNITLTDVATNPNLPWDWGELSANKFGCSETILYYAGRRDETIIQTRVFWEEMMAVVWQPDGAMMRYYWDDMDI